MSVRFEGHHGVEVGVFGAGVVVLSVCRFLGVGIGGVLVGVGVTDWVVTVGWFVFVGWFVIVGRLDFVGWLDCVGWLVFVGFVVVVAGVGVLLDVRDGLVEP